MKKILLVFCTMFLFCSAVTANAFEIGVQATAWRPALSGDIAVDNNNIIGTSLDFEDDFDFEDENILGLEATLSLGSHRLTVSYHEVDYKGDTTLTRDIFFNGELFHVGDLISTELSYSAIDATYHYTLIDLENILAGFSIDLLGKVKYIKGTCDIDSRLLSTQKVSEDIKAPIPMLGVGAHVAVLADILEARAQISGISYGDSSVIDGMVEAAFSPFPFVDIVGGYRLFSVSIDEDDNEFDYSMTGPYAGVAIKF